MNNYDKDFLQDLIDSVEKSFKFTSSGSSGENKNRSAKKVDGIHGTIASHLQILLGEDYIVKTKNTTGKEEIIKGRYNDKRVDILVERKVDNKAVAGLRLKFPLSNFQKNLNNYFENMLGETANIRSNNIPYFQVIILLKNIPNFSGPGNISSFTELKNHLMEKYLVLSSDNTNVFYHSPLKTLVLILKDDIESKYIKSKTKDEYYNSFRGDFKFSLSNSVDIRFDPGVILNQYEIFLEKMKHLIKGFD